MKTSEAPQPLWIAFPRIPWGSAGWRMGWGEEYWREWEAWFKSQSSDDRRAYCLSWPEPEGWAGFFAFIETGVHPPWFLERQRKIAEAAKTPMPGESEITDYYRILWLIRSHFSRSAEYTPADEKTESFAQLYSSPDGGKWRLTGLKPHGMLFKRVE